MAEITEAIIASSNGHTIVSNTGIEYKPSQLRAVPIGDYAAKFNSGIISKEEQRGEWTIKEAY